MRPDEHKKKKNAQYKKKHGISAKGQQTESKFVDNDNKKSSKAKWDSVSRARYQTEEPKSSENTVGLKNGGDVDSVTEDVKQYRRQIVSNWSRYEDSSESDDDVPHQRGEDFNKLLAEAGGSAAQFRLKDEEDWGDDKMQSTPHLLELDIENLAESLDCISLHKKLGIDENLFTQEQKTEMLKSATESESRYTVKVKEHSQMYIDSDGSVFQEHTCGKEKNKETAKKAKIITEPKCEPEMNTSVSDWKEVNGVYASNNSEMTVSGRGSNKLNTTDVQNLEDDLDMILSLGNPRTEHNNDNIKHDLRSSGRSEETVKPNVSSNITVSKQKKPGTGTDNLEDWLDSMLDD